MIQLANPIFIWLWKWENKDENCITTGMDCGSAMWINTEYTQMTYAAKHFVISE